MTSGHSGSTSLQVLNLGAGFDTLYWRLRDHIRSHCVEEKLVGQVASQGDSRHSTQTKFKFQQVDNKYVLIYVIYVVIKLRRELQFEPRVTKRYLVKQLF